MRLLNWTALVIVAASFGYTTSADSAHFCGHGFELDETSGLCVDVDECTTRKGYETTCRYR